MYSTLILVVDIGNTRAKWGVIALQDLVNGVTVDRALQPQADLPWLMQSVCEHEALQDLPRHIQKRMTQHPSMCLAQAQVAQVWFSNVADAKYVEILQHAYQLASIQEVDHVDTLQNSPPSFHRFDLSMQFASSMWDRKPQPHWALCNLYEFPEKLGTDRFASSMAAHFLFPNEHLLVVSCGTATTIDAVLLESSPHYIGGMILPGLATMAQSLHVNTAQLPQLSQLKENLCSFAAFATNTQQAIASGCLHAQIGAVACAIKNLEEKINGLNHQHPTEPAKSLRCVITGGAAMYLQEKLLETLHYELNLIDNLVLLGVALAAYHYNSEHFLEKHT